MKSIILITLLSLFCFTLAQVQVSSEEFGPVDNYATITFWSDEQCTQFVGAKSFNQQPQTIQGTSNQPCEVSMRCLYDSTSSGCELISHNFQDVKQSIYTNVAGSVVVANVDGVDNYYSSFGCFNSTLFENCYFKFYTEAETRFVMNTYAATASSSILLPCISLIFALLFVL